MADHDQYAEHFDAGHSGKDHTVHQRMRANSTIMELKKILGTPPLPFPLRRSLPEGQLDELVVADFVWLVANRGEIRKLLTWVLRNFNGS